MRINNNLMAMNTHRQLGNTNANGARSMERLSSGFRINRAGDDAAGLAISEKMRAQIRGLNQASRNAQDGISLIQTAEGSLGETQAILQRMRELAVQAASDTNVQADRGEIQNEMNQLTSEIDRIANTTEFNTQKLLNGGAVATGAVSVTNTTAHDAGGTIGEIGSVSQTDGAAGTDAEAASLTIGGDHGFTVTAAASGEDGNTYTVTIVQGTGASVATAGVVDSDGNLVITLGTDGDENPLSVNSNDIANLTLTGDGAALISIAAIGDADAEIGVADQTNLAGGQEIDPGTQGTTTFTITTALGAGDTLSIGGETITVYEDDAALAAANSGAGDSFGISLQSAATADAQATAIRGMTFSGLNTEGSEATVTLTQDVNGTGNVDEAALSGANATAASTTFSITTALAEGETLEVAGVTFTVTADGSGGATELSAADDVTAQAEAISNHINGLAAFNGSVSGAAVTVAQSTAGTGDIGTPTVSAAGGDGYTATLQIGANTAQSFDISIADMRADALNIFGEAGTSISAKDGTTATLNAQGYLDLSSHESATNAITFINDAIESVSGERSKLGAFQNRLESTIRNLESSAENIQASESRIRDVDMAKEMMEFTKQNILEQAATAMLAQANQAPQSVLQLLR